MIQLFLKVENLTIALIKYGLCMIHYFIIILVKIIRYLRNLVSIEQTSHPTNLRVRVRVRVRARVRVRVRIRIRISIRVGVRVRIKVRVRIRVRGLF